MRPSTLLTSTILPLSLTSARIIGLAAPKTLAPGSPFTLTLLTENYIQSVADISAAWGYSPTPGHLYSLGSFISSAYLGPDKSNTLENVTLEATVPQELSGDAWKGKQVVLGSAVFSLYGASSGPTVANFNVTVTIGDETSDEYVRSEGFAWGTAGEC